MGWEVVIIILTAISSLIAIGVTLALVFHYARPSLAQPRTCVTSAANQQDALACTLARYPGECWKLRRDIKCTKWTGGSNDR